MLLPKSPRIKHMFLKMQFFQGFHGFVSFAQGSRTYVTKICIHYFSPSWLFYKKSCFQYILLTFANLTYQRWRETLRASFFAIQTTKFHSTWRIAHIVSRFFALLTRLDTINDKTRKNVNGFSFYPDSDINGVINSRNHDLVMSLGDQV